MMNTGTSTSSSGIHSGSNTKSMAGMKIGKELPKLGKARPNVREPAMACGITKKVS